MSRSSQFSCTMERQLLLRFLLSIIFVRLAAWLRDKEKHLKGFGSIALDTSYVHLIQRDIKSLSRLRDEIHLNRVICCAIDY